MYKLLILLFCFSATIAAQTPVQTYKNPVIPHDFPDPSVIRVGEDYYAAGTTSDLAPSYPVYHSRDLVNWERIGAIFNDPPAWIQGDCWAPELFYHNGTFFAYYTARKKSDHISCIGVATTKDITKGFEDKGPLIEWGSEAIDAFVFKDEDGQLYITWKAYGLDPSRPIEILASELADDGLTLVGEHFTLTDHSKGWRGNGDEGQVVLKRNGYYYHFYSVGGCCDNRCDYRIEVARSKSLRGDWEQYAGNPILEGGDLWKCSGHGTIVQSPEGRYFYLYHAYHTYDFEFIGRQGLLDELLWDDEAGWPYFKYGRNPSLQAEVPFANTVQKRETQFYDNFATPEKDKYWLWDMNLPRPVLTKNNGKLTFASEGIGFCFRGVNVQTGNYTMETAVRNEGCHLKGVCVYGNSTNLFTIGVEEEKVKLYQIEKGNQTELFSRTVDAPEIYLRVESINARFFRFSWSTDQQAWHAFPDGLTALDGIFLPQWGKGVRAGLLIDAKQAGDSGTFSYFLLDNKY